MEQKRKLAPKYEHLQVEQGKYQYWLEQGYFNSGDITKKTYTIVIPPPNVTGRLHLGHAWDTTLQDIIIRQKRMDGFDALYLPGMDHAGIATQTRIEAKLREQKLSRYDLGREKFLKVAWEWKEEYSKIIREQWAALGLSLDYNHERFTLDKGLNEAVNHVFISLYQQGLIYRGERIINWDIQSKTALSNIEVDYKDIEGAFYHFIYPLTGEVGGLEVATTRPETMFGDVALMVHPDDERYQKFIGLTVYIPGTNKVIPVIADNYVDKAIGTGVVKVTPAHDPNDFEVGNRHQLERIICMNEDGTMNDKAYEFAGLDRFDCRQKVVEKLQKLNLCPKIEKMIHAVGHSERTGVVVEPRLSKQWFVRMNELADDVLIMQDRAETKINFVPERFNKTFSTWLENTQDWCISRQLWWGHRIPAWYRGDEVVISITSPGDDYIQDPDVLDTWFSSALWPFSSLGWTGEKESDDYHRYYPTDCLVTGYDLIFFWVARMAFQGRHFTAKAPFKNCLLHGLIRDEQGRKMSKSLNNGIDPFDLIEKFGCDSMRYFLTTNVSPGQDLSYSEEKVAAAWNYINKLWNISRYISMNLDAQGYQNESIDYAALSEIDIWLLKRLDTVIEKINENFETFDFGEIAKSIYNFAWDDFASWYLELTKVVFQTKGYEKINTCAILKHVLTTITKLLHPFMPFVTEEIYQIFNSGSVMVAQWPKKDPHLENITSSGLVDTLIQIITVTRQIRADKKVAPSKAIPIYLEITTENQEMYQKIANFLTDHDLFIKRFVNYQELVITKEVDKTNAVVSFFDSLNVVIPLSHLIDLAEEKARLSKEQVRLENEIKRAQTMLENPNFIKQAPESKINAEKGKLDSYQKQLLEVLKMLSSM